MLLELDAKAEAVVPLEWAGQPLCGSLNVRAPEGTQALDLARAERPDLVLLNVGLPQMNGQQIFRRSRPTRERREPRW